MPIIDLKKMLSELKVREAMRRIAVSIGADTTIEQAIRCAIKHKITAILVTDKSLEPLGVVSKTDIMSAYYAAIPLDSPAELIMTSPPVFCELDDSLEQVLRTMRRHYIHRVYVRNEERGPATGIISYPDLVGLLYRYCHKCEKSIQRKLLQGDSDPNELLRVRDVMTPTVKMMDVNESLTRVMEELSTHRFGAILIAWSGIPAGVISKTDLILAYKHGVPAAARAHTIMRTPLRSCSENDELGKVIRYMIFSDIRRFFVYRGDPDDMVGVLSLSDAAQARSGSCRACMPSRIEVL